ncbi:MAG: GNAT family N-acetyltransferase, partial [Caulobacteraceae bacterium]|nr:GNAT family N-acetyltransferase [Caulobacteraceae bacterium]
MSAAMHTIRPAEPRDVAALSALGGQTFVDTFVHGYGIPYPKADLDAFLEDSFGEFATARALTDPEQRWWVAEDLGGRLGGFAQTGPCSLPHAEASKANGELKRLYIGKHAQGHGLGTKLLELALADIAERFTGPEWIGVWSGNDKAIR